MSSAASKPFSLSLSERDALTVAAMSAALALPVEGFLGQVVTAWLEKPNNFKRFARRLLENSGGASAKDSRAHARELARSLDRSQGTQGSPAKKKKKKAPKKTKSTTRKASRTTATRTTPSRSTKASAGAASASEAASRPAG